eukprot:TRINITY_DN314_c0_g2_i1.p2 TRINITY_DN314_c0_g2~~TRINITY_DN314_c0_g2_i1.p2  ORF type:complete len:106 (+),score=32.39 TRINITY_DN314_c0_g2_i1:52-369(+)
MALLRSLVRAQPFSRLFSARAVFLSQNEVESRVINVLKSIPRVDSSKLTSSSSFVHDLELDEIDASNVVSALQNEFCVELPSDHATAISSVGAAVSYFSAHPRAK